MLKKFPVCNWITRCRTLTTEARNKFPVLSSTIKFTSSRNLFLRSVLFLSYCVYSPPQKNLVCMRFSAKNVNVFLNSPCALHVLLTSCYRAGSCKILDLYAKSNSLESRQCYRLSWVRIFVVVLNPYRWIQTEYLQIGHGRLLIIHDQYPIISNPISSILLKECR